MIKHVCPICGEKYIAKRKEQIFCSVKCRRINSRKKIKVVCETCKKEFYKFPKEVKKTKHNFCCKECFDKYQKQENKIIILKYYAKFIINSEKSGTFEVKIDIEDIEKIKNYKWAIRKTREGIFYVQSKYFISTNTKKTIQLHRLIMNCPNNKVIDHINSDPLDNRKSNLRICTSAENAQNKKVNKNNTSGYRGVCYDKNYNRWTGQVNVNKKHYIKHFETKEEANEWCIKIRSELMPFSTN